MLHLRSTAQEPLSVLIRNRAALPETIMSVVFLLLNYSHQILKKRLKKHQAVFPSSAEKHQLKTVIWFKYALLTAFLTKTAISCLSSVIIRVLSE